MVGIYKITNIVNGKVYVGQTSDHIYRWTHHRSDLDNKRHHNQHLQSAWNKYGKDSFIFEFIEECSEKDLDIREEYWIKFYNSYEDGYNLDLGGRGIRGYKHTQEQIDKMRRIQSPAIVLQFDLNFNFVNEWIGGATHVNKVLKYTRECIVLRCKHTLKGMMTPYKESYWVYKDEYNSPNFSWSNYLQNIPCVDIDKILIPERDKCINQYSRDGALIKEWSSLKEIHDAGYDDKIIKNLCNKSIKRKMYLECIWAYSDTNIYDGYYETVFHPTTNKDKSKKVCMMNLDWVELNIFNSLTEASRYLKGNDSLVPGICKSAKTLKSTAGGYRWKYAQ